MVTVQVVGPKRKRRTGGGTKPAVSVRVVDKPRRVGGGTKPKPVPKKVKVSKKRPEAPIGRGGIHRVLGPGEILTTSERIQADIDRFRSREAGRAGEPFVPGFAPAPQPPTAEVKAAQAAAELEEAGAFEEVTPGEVSLAPPKQFGEEIPIVGPETAALQSVLVNAVNKGWLPIFKTKKGKDPFPMTPETLREAALHEVRNEAFNEGISVRESFGSLIEAIPFVGGAAGRYIGGLVEAPFANAQNVIGEINKIKEAASTGQEKVRNGLEDPSYGLGRAREMEEDIFKLEGRLKLLINTSAILRANTDQINLIQEGILEAREKVARYRQASSFGLTAQMTGTGRLIPTDEQMYFELERLKEGK